MPRSQSRCKETLYVRYAYRIFLVGELFFQAGSRAIMYLDFYDLQQDPFSNTAAPGMLFQGGSHKAALQAMIDGLQAGQEFITLLGKPGLGKTFLLHAALAHSA